MTYDPEKIREKNAARRMARQALRAAEVALGTVPHGAMVRDRVGSITDVHIYQWNSNTALWFYSYAHSKGHNVRAFQPNRNIELTQEKLTEMYIGQEPVSKDLLYGKKFS